jgi:hypothetical protein
VNVNLSHRVSKDIWVHIDQVEPSTTTRNEPLGNIGADYRQDGNPLPSETDDNLRYLQSDKSRKDKINEDHTKLFEKGWYLKIPAGKTVAQYVFEALQDNKAEPTELARFQVVDYIINSPAGHYNKKASQPVDLWTKGHGDRFYSDNMSPDKLLIKNGKKYTVDVNISDQAGLELHANGSTFGFRQIWKVPIGATVKLDFEAYQIPDGLRITDNMGTYYDTGGLISNHRSASFTVDKNSTGFLNVVVTGNIDPSTKWDLDAMAQAAVITAPATSSESGPKFMTAGPIGVLAA